jgi:hypothetical protein
MSSELRTVLGQGDAEPLRFAGGLEQESIEVNNGERSREQETLTRIDVFGLEA